MQAGGTTPYLLDLTEAADGSLIFCGYYTAIGDLSTASGIARWTGAAMIPAGIEIASTATNSRCVASGAYEYYTVRALGSAATTYDGVATVTLDAGAAPTPVVLTVTGAGSLRRIVNITTGAAIAFNDLALIAGDTVTIDTAARTVTSTYRDDLARHLIGGSALATFTLHPGANIIAVHHTSSSATATISYTPRYLNYDA